MASETKQRTQREDLRTDGDAELVEGGEALGPELLEVCEETGGRTRRVLSSMIHSTACATAEGKLIYHCSLALRVASS